MAGDQIEEIRNKTDIVALVQEYIQLNKAGRNYKGLCPFHGEKTPSFMVNPELQIFKCFGCGAGGDAFSFLQKIDGMEFGEALKHLAQKAGVKLVSYRPSQIEEVREKLVKINHLAGEAYHYLLTSHKLGEAARKYLQQRGIADETIKKFKLGYAPPGWDFVIRYLKDKKGYKEEDLERAGLVVRVQREGGARGIYDRFRDRIMFPLNNHRGQTVGFAGRVMPGADERAGGKYVNTPETEIYHKSELLYGLDITRGEIKQAGEAVIVEGEIDAMASWQAGVKNIAAIKGSALTPKQVELLRRLAETVILALDQDVAGDLASRRGIEIATKAGLVIKVVQGQAADPDYKYKDPGEAAIADPELWQRVVREAVPIYDFFIDSAVKRFGLDATGKGKISREMGPILAGVEDEIVKAHYVKKMAGILGVGEEDVRRQVQKLAVPTASGAGPGKPQDVNINRKEVVEKEVIRLALLGKRTGELVIEPMAKWISTPFWIRVAGELGKGRKVNDLPAELKEQTADLLMAEWEFSEKEWVDALTELEKEYVREERTRLDPEKDLTRIRDLDRRWNELTNEKKSGILR